VVATVALQGAIGGGVSNTVGDTWRTVIAGGEHNVIADLADYSALGGGRQNRIATGAGAATIAGGDNNVVSNNASYAAIPGGRSNVVGAVYGFAAGRRARALHQGAFVWGDATDADVDSTANNQVTFRAGGGFRVLGGAISGDASGLTNFPAALVRNASATPGALALSTNNSATAAQAAALGGAFNVASGVERWWRAASGTPPTGWARWWWGAAGSTSCCSGGQQPGAGRLSPSWAAAGTTRPAGRYASVVGGKDNLAGGAGSVVPGGVGNRALGTYSLAAGRQAGALHEGTFVWADAQAADFESTDTNQFLIRARGGLGLNTVAPSATLHVVGSPTLGSMLVAPQEAISGDDAELVLAEDTTGNFAMRLRYDGGLNQFRLFGVENRTNYGPHLVVARDDGYVGSGRPRRRRSCMCWAAAGPSRRCWWRVRPPRWRVDAAPRSPSAPGAAGWAILARAIPAARAAWCRSRVAWVAAGGLAGQGGDVVIAGGPASGFGVPGRVLVRGGTGLVGGQRYCWRWGPTGRVGPGRHRHDEPGHRLPAVGRAAPSAARRWWWRRAGRTSFSSPVMRCARWRRCSGTLTSMGGCPTCLRRPRCRPAASAWAQRRPFCSRRWKS
jgi:hypothetical protein